MFNSVSWQFFLTSATLLVVGYYAITIVLFFYKDILHRVKSNAHPSATPSTSTLLKKHSSTDFMGATSTKENDSRLTPEVSAEEIFNTSKNEEPQLVAPATIGSDDLLIGSVADLLQEIKTVIQLIAEYRTGKSESRALFHALFIRYPHLQNTSYPHAISFYISDASKEQFDFQVTVDEALSWWNPTADSAEQ